MKNLYTWIWNHMKAVAIAWVVLPMMTIPFPGTAVPVFVFVVLASVFMGICDSLWIDEVPYPGGEE